MTQNYLLAQLLQSNSGKNLITEILDSNPDFNVDNALNLLKANPETKRILDKLSEAEINALSEELVFNSTNSEFQGFKTGVDFALTLIGLEPIYNVLPESIKKEFWN